MRCGAFFLVVLFVISCGSVKKAAISDDEVIVAFGDSITYGVGATKNNSYPSILSKLLGREVIACGVSGETTKQGLRRLPQVLKKYSPKILLLCLGGNDFLRRHSKESTIANLEAMIKLAQQQNIEVVLIGVPRPSVIISTAAFYPQLATKYSLVYEGNILQKVLAKKSFKSDLIHPNAEGYALIAQSIADVLYSSGLIEQ
ncbi:arylesterase [Candidatus Uabimicrobium sp. HlEnr_7]|uniref:arylesterase n=1 Tax=Candidatus Uabimicrobium helgolandensis TaxID=3095367 RepID=UPI0035565845